MSKIICRRWAVDLSACVPTLSQLTLAVAAVQPEERTRLNNFVFMEDFLSSLVGRLLMRKFVSESTGIDYSNVHFERDERGKPYLCLKETSKAGVVKQWPQISFNVSHHGKFVVLAGLVAENILTVAAGNAEFGVGVDVMKIEYSGGKPLYEFFRLMRNKFADNEWRYINRIEHTEMDRVKAFMRHWCLKESYVKELGVGITIDLQNISFIVDQEKDTEMNAPPLTSTTVRYNDAAMSNWHFEEHLLQHKYCVAIAFRNCQPKVGKFQILSFDDLLVKNSKSTEVDIVNFARHALRKQKKTKSRISH